MANLAKALGLTSNMIILVGKPELTNTVDSNNQPFFACKLKEPVTVRCSVDALIEPYETDEVFVRQSAVMEADWEFVNPEKPEEGFYMKDWVVDFSKSHKLPLYQETTIRQWANGNRDTRRLKDRQTINEGIRERMKNLKK